eukprot:TRINITY_DN16982_c0_g1_i2.p1 TRINITY_DN16982_c0_g1~~TRINITY_DN16982_c0_g1_i2.p1  ORF type:complete len:602 (-),score=119.15 TRINITY_DN16982_c0_g1_i2:7-1812(-)
MPAPASRCKQNEASECWNAGTSAPVSLPPQCGQLGPDDGGGPPPRCGNDAELSAMSRQLGQLLRGQAEVFATVLSISRDVASISSVAEQEKALPRGGVNGSECDVSSCPRCCGAMPAQGADLFKKSAKVQGGSALSRMSGMSRSSFAPPTRTLIEDQELLTRLFNVADVIETSKVEKRKSNRNLNDRIVNMMRWLWGMKPEDLELVIDSAMGIIITLNAAFIGMRMDADDPNSTIWAALDIVFTVIFLIELSIKIRMHGICFQFCGPSRASNCFDAFIIFLDLVQLFITYVLTDFAKNMAGQPSASLFRIIRLAKLTRVLRLLKAPIFKDLLAMIQGMLGGMATLFWSMVLFFLTVYVVALVFRETLGKQQKDSIYEMFDSVPRSMFTTFRCSFGDCNTKTGSPLFEHVTDEYGGVFSLMYSFFIFTISIGIFNVISAIFVESTMHAAAAIQLNKKKARLMDQGLWASRLTVLIRQLLGMCNENTAMKHMADSVEEILDIDIPASIIDELAQDEVALKCLLDLDVVSEDVEHLSTILDPDNGGTIAVIELVEGIKKLRGDPRRSDIITVDLMIRSIQRDLVVMKEDLVHLKKGFGCVPQNI